MSLRLCLVAAVAWATAGLAQAAPAGAELVRPGLYRVDGAVARVGDSGLVVVDTRNAGAYPGLAAALQASADGAGALPIRALVITAAGSESAAPAAAPALPLVVQRRALQQLTGGRATAGLITYDADYVLRVGGVEVEVEHVGRGRTGVDSVAFFRDLRVVAVGDLYTHGTPEPDCASGGSYAGWAAAISHLLYFDFDIAVPRQGPPVDKAQLRELRARLQAMAAEAPAGTSASACKRG